MGQERITQSLLKRVSHGPNLALVFGIGSIFCLFRLFAGPGQATLWELILPFPLLMAHLALAPLPWQWTDRSGAPLGQVRGFLVALLFHSAWIALLLGLAETARPRHPHPPAPPALEEGPAPGMPPHHAPRTPFLGLGLVNLTFALAFGWTLAEKEATEARERRMADLLRQSRSRSLQNQLEPHVLYNALSSLSELIYEDPLAAEEVITRLADLYRFLTVHGQKDRVPLGDERRLVEAYLAMEQMRLGERLRVTWDWAGDVEEVLIPPLLLQPLVENAIKHGISPSDIGGDLCLRCRREGAWLALEVANSGSPFVPGGPAGIGLGGLEARLELWEGSDASFSLEPRPDGAVATVRWRPA